MSSNKELVAQAVATIPLWRAFLDKKEAEQDALLAEVRNEEVQLPETTANKPEDLATDPSLAEVRNEEVQLPESSNQEFQNATPHALVGQLAWRRKDAKFGEAAANKPEDLATNPSTDKPLPVESVQVTPQVTPPITSPPITPPSSEEEEEEFDSDEEEFNDLF